MQKKKKSKPMKKELNLLLSGVVLSLADRRNRHLAGILCKLLKTSSTAVDITKKIRRTLTLGWRYGVVATVKLENKHN